MAGSEYDDVPWLSFGEGLPSEDPDPARAAVSLDVTIWLKKQRARELGPGRSICLHGADIGDSFLFADRDPAIENAAPVIFSCCRFRESVFFRGIAFGREVTFRDCVVGNLAMDDCSASDILIRNSELKSLRLSRTKVKSKITLWETRIREVALFNESSAEELIVRKTSAASLRTDGGEFRRIGCLFAHFAEVELRRTRGEDVLVGGGATLQKVRLLGLELGGSLSLATEGSEGADFVLKDCTIAGKLTSKGKCKTERPASLLLDHVTVKGPSKLDFAEITTVSFRQTMFDDTLVVRGGLEKLDFLDARFGRNLVFRSLTAVQRLELDRVEVTNLLELTGLRQLAPPSGGTPPNWWLRRSRFGEVTVRRSSLPIGMRLANCIIAGGASAQYSLLGTLRLDDTHLGGALLVDSCRVVELALHSSRVNGVTLVAPRRGNFWNGAGILAFRDSDIGRLRFGDGSRSLPHTTMLPEQTDLHGCTYADLPRFNMPTSGEDRINLCLRVLGSASVEPQPYVQMARLLRAQGYASAADDVQYAERRAALSAAISGRHWGTALVLGALRASIGFGIGLRYFRAVPWALLAIGCGAVVLAAGDAPAGLTEPKTWFWRIGASADQLLPIIKISPRYAAFFEERQGDVLSFWQNAYFAAHRGFGWLLGTFILAGLAGLTQKPPGG